MRLRFFRPLLGLDEALFEFADAGKIFVELFGVALAEVPRRALRLRMHGVHDALAFAEFLHLRLDFLRAALEEEFREDPDGRPSPGIITPPRVQERLPLFTLPVQSARLAKRVSVPRRSAASWSSEMLLRKLGVPGCGAAVRKETSEACPPSTCGCESPEKMVRSSRKSRSASRYGVSA